MSKEKEIVIEEGKNSKLLEILKTNEISISEAQEMLRAVLSGSYSTGNLNKYLTSVSELENKKKESKDALLKADQTKLDHVKQSLKFQQKVKAFIDVLSTKGFTNDEAAEVLLPFADPTFDTTFKELFGLDKHNDLLISLLNNLLSFSGADKITSVRTISEKLQTSGVSYKKGESGITSEVDILCTTESGQTIAVEMQRAKQPYFLARMEYYMSKLIASQVKEKDGSTHHKTIDKTYILVLAKESLFTGQHSLEITQTPLKPINSSIDINKIYEINVQPVILETGQEFPDNKMHWKFFELSKFKEHNDSKDITKNSNLKHQWLEFIVDCSSQLTEPNRNELIQKGYNIMKTLQQDALLKAKYWNEQASEIEAIAYQDELVLKAKKEGKEEGKLEGLEEGEFVGKLKTYLNIDIKKVQKFFKSNSEATEFKGDLGLINKKSYLEQLNQGEFLGKRTNEEKFSSILDYVGVHSNDKPDKIYNELGLVGESMNLDGISHCDEWSVYSSS
jgi:predicted transposase/invertase (TIGR01784 family)